MASLSELLYDIKRISEHRKELTDKKIKKIYQSLSKSLDAFIADGYKKYADNDGRFYISYLDAQNKKAKFLREIAENVASVTPEIKKEILSLVDDTYSKSYQGMMTAFKKADTSEKFEEITRDIEVNPNVLKSAVDNNINKLTLPAVLEKHRQEVIYQIQKELNIGLIQGDRYEKMAKRISERVNVSYNKAMNITRTETHRNIESGFMDCAEHIQKGLENSNFIYAVTWRTMKDERVRPNQRRKTKKGWVTGKSKNGANHQIMEGVTVKVGELFDLGDGVKAKAPSQTGVAGHDCNCRCFLEYNLMTVEEFEKKTGRKGEKGVENDGESVIIETEKVKTVATVEEARQALIDDIGFGVVDDSLDKINPDQYIQNTNQLLKLEHKFGCIHKSGGMTICSQASNDANAYVGNTKTHAPMASSTLSLCPKNYKKTIAETITDMQNARTKRWHMPFADGDEVSYIVTHEYGHILQNLLEQQRMIEKGLDLNNPMQFVDKSKFRAKTKAAQEKAFKWYKDISKEVQDEFIDEILSIAERNPDFILEKNLSRYSTKSECEFFAEVFANSQLGAPNELGKAMNIWLKQKGLIKQ